VLITGISPKIPLAGNSLSSLGNYNFCCLHQSIKCPLLEIYTLGKWHVHNGKAENIPRISSVPLFWFGCGRQQKRHAAAPPPAGVRRRRERNGQKPVGRDKGSLTEQQTKGTGTTMIQIRRKHNTNRTTHRAALPNRTAAAARCRAESEFPPPRSPPPEPSLTAHGMEHPALLGQVGSAPPGCAPS